MEDPFWTHDTDLFDGSFRYYGDKKQPIRAKLHVSEEEYWNGSNEIVRLKNLRGVRSYVMMRPYVLEPQITMSVALYPKAKPYADSEQVIGKTTGTRVEGVRDVQIGQAQAWYYPEDEVIVMWECFLNSFVRDAPLVEDENMMLLWNGFEQWLIKAYPGTKRICTPWSEPIWPTKDYQQFLKSRGYRKATPGVFAKRLLDVD